jgi:hypothetical protein
LWNFLHSPVTSPLLGPSILLRTLSSNTLSLCSTVMWETKFHAHTKQLLELWFCELWILRFRQSLRHTKFHAPLTPIIFNTD